MTRHCSSSLQRWTLVLTLALIGLLPALSVAARPSTLPVSEVSGKLVRDPEWISYRRARRAIEVFEAYPGPKDLIRPLYHLDPRTSKGFSFDGLILAIEDDETVVPLRQLRGWAEMPMHPPVQLDQARFVANRPKGSVDLNFYVTLAVRADQRYEPAHLRQACEQSLAFIRAESVVNKLMLSGKRCVGVTVSLLVDETAVVLRKVDGTEAAVALRQGRSGPMADVRWTPEMDAMEIRPADRPHVLSMLVE